MPGFATALRIVEATRYDYDLVIGNSIYKSMLICNAARPRTMQLILQWFWFADAREW